jgi:hypothetical protein
MDINGVLTLESATAGALLRDILPHFTAGYLHNARGTTSLDPTVDIICGEALRLEIWLGDQNAKRLDEHIETLERVLVVFEGLVKPKALLSCQSECLVSHLVCSACTFPLEYHHSIEASISHVGS